MRHKQQRSGWSRRELIRMGGVVTASGVAGGFASSADVQGSSVAAPAPASGPEIYTRIGVRPFINLTGSLTINGGPPSLQEVRDAKHQAAGYSVDLDELMEKVGDRISELIGCEGAIVTAGAAAALTQATAACLAGTDPELIQQLPDLTGLKSEVIMPRESRNQYDHAFRTLGVRMVNVDSVESFHAALGERTALVAVNASALGRGQLTLETLVAGAARIGVPVVVDAAAHHPRKPDPFLTRGASMVAYSGGKFIRGPQCAGLLLGRKDLVWAAFMNGAPHHAFARMMKVGKEEILGMLAAVEVLMTRGVDDDQRRWTAAAQTISQAVTKVPGVRTEMRNAAGPNPYTTMVISWDPEQVGITAGELNQQLLAGEPRIKTHASGDGSSFNVRPLSMRPDDAEPAARRIAEVLRSAPRGRKAPAPSPPLSDIAGAWDVQVQFSRGSARHRLFLETSGNKVTGQHTALRLECELSGTVSGDRVKLTSTTPYQGTRLTYRFDGRIVGQDMVGDVDLGEYGAARWTAARRRSKEA